MDSVFNIWETNRLLFLKLVNELSFKQLNTIPDGYNNNIIWNIGHIITVQQALIYKSSGLDICLSEEVFNNYKPGSFPNKNISKENIMDLKLKLTSIIQLTKADYNTKMFSNFKPFKTNVGFNLTTIDAAFKFNNYHEAMHYGIVKSLSKLV